MISSILKSCGLLTMLHAGYSAMEFNSSNITVEGARVLPLDISMEAIVGMLVAITGVILGATFESIDIEEELKKTPISSIQAQSSMRLTNHRGRFIFT